MLVRMVLEKNQQQISISKRFITQSTAKELLMTSNCIFWDS